MLMVDLRNANARLTMREFLASGRRYASNPIAFASFASGLRFGPDAILDERWQLSASASSRFAFFRVMMHEMLPLNYDVRHLEALGGRFALSLKPAGEYTVIALNRRVVTLSGLPREEATGAPVADVTMRPDVFVALCNELIADLSERTLQALGKAG